MGPGREGISDLFDTYDLEDTGPTELALPAPLHPTRGQPGPFPTSSQDVRHECCPQDGRFPPPFLSYPPASRAVLGEVKDTG